MLIDGKTFFETPVKIKEEAYEAIIEMSKNNDYTAGNLLDSEYFKDRYKLIAINLSKQIELENPDLKQQVTGVAAYTNVAFKNFAPFTRCVTNINDEQLKLLKIWI